jgi:hypothetical protein
MGGIYARFLFLRKASRMLAPHVDGRRWEHVRGLNVPAWRKWANRYSAGNIPDVAADFLASATGWALHKRTCVDRDATRLRCEASKVRPLAAPNVLSRLAHYHAIARILTVAADHLGPVERSVFTKAGIEREIHTTRIGLKPLCTETSPSRTWKTPSTPFPGGVSLKSCTRISTCNLLSRWLK